MTLYHRHFQCIFCKILFYTHITVHFGFAQIKGKGDQALKHFMTINGLGKDKAVKLINDSFVLWQKRSKKQWKLDISMLQEYGIDTHKIEIDKSSSRSSAD